MSPRKQRTESEDNAALAEEAARLEAKNALDDNDSGAVESAALSEVAVVMPDAEIVAETPTSPLLDEIVAEAPEPPAPVWTPSTNPVMPDWVIHARRIAWKVPELPAGAEREDAPRDEWIGGDVGYRYFKGGHVLATFRKGGFGVLEVEPVEALDADPEPAPEPAT